jgi:hypothetical protein
MVLNVVKKIDNLLRRRYRNVRGQKTIAPTDSREMERDPECPGRYGRSWEDLPKPRVRVMEHSCGGIILRKQVR